MGIMVCVERTSSRPMAEDAVWVKNGDQLYYPYVSSCVSVTLVFEKGLLGGHASQTTTNEKDGDFRQAENLKDVITRMKDKDPGMETRGALRRIYFIGLIDTENWDLDQAAKFIAEKFERPQEGEPRKYNRTPADIVFDTTDRQLSMLQSSVVEGRNEAEKINYIKLIGASESYSA
jgi:hypothetical protein